MLKWLGGLIDSNEKEMGRLRGIVAQVNQKIVELLNDELDDLREWRADLADLSCVARIGSRLLGVVVMDDRRVAEHDDSVRLPRRHVRVCEVRRSLAAGMLRGSR